MTYLERVDATIVITTRNRKESLRVAVQSAVTQKGNVEVLVVDDTSDDGTYEMLRAEFPTVRVIRAEEPRGYIVQRNHGAALAKGNYIFSIDDDAAFTSDTVVQEVVAEFDDPRIGAVAIPFCNVNESPKVFQTAPDDQGVWCQAIFIGTAHALRRDLFLAMGGYREHYFHQGEERDWALRALELGYVVRISRSDRIDHFVSPRRDVSRMDSFGRRNDILFAWHNAPLMSLPLTLARSTVAGLVFGLKVRRPGIMVRGLWRGYCGLVEYWGMRAAVSPAVWKVFRRMRSPVAFQDLKAVLPPCIDIKMLAPHGETSPNCHAVSSAV